MFENFVGFVISVLALQASALDFTPDSSRVLSDLAYLPKQDQFVSTTNYSYTRMTGDVFDYLGATKNSFTTTSNSLSQTYADGISDDLTLSITAAYGKNSTTNKLATGSSAASVAYGLDDPVLEMVWRVLDQKDNAVNWDLIGSYAPDLVQAVAASAIQVGSVARGGQATTLGTALSYKTRDFTVYIDGSATYLSRRNVSDNINVITTYNSNWQYSLSLNTQTRLNEVFAINAGMTEIFHNNVYGTNDTTLITFDNKAGNLTTFNVALVYNITPNRLVTTLTYNREINSKSSIDYATQPASNTTTKSKSANVIGARLQYMFD
jgi:hypothetical protein